MCKTKSVYLKKEVKEILKTKDNQNGYINNAIALYSCLEETINPVLLQAFISDPSQFEVMMEFINHSSKETSKCQGIMESNK